MSYSVDHTLASEWDSSSITQNEYSCNQPVFISNKHSLCRSVEDHVETTAASVRQHSVAESWTRTWP
jgi:hypothetical protein